MTKTLQLGLLFLGALALSFTLATAEGKCGDSKEEMKCQAGKCANATKEAPKMKCQAGKCGGDMKKETKTNPAPAKGKCAQGKCGS